MISAVCYSCYDEPAARKLFVQRAKSKLVAADTRGAVRNLRTRGTPPRPHPPCTLPPSAHPPRTLHSHFSPSYGGGFLLAGGRWKNPSDLPISTREKWLWRVRGGCAEGGRVQGGCGRAERASGSEVPNGSPRVGCHRLAFCPLNEQQLPCCRFVLLSALKKTLFN